MKLKNVYEIADMVAPFSLSMEECTRFGHYDNSGIQLDCGEEIRAILFSLDLSMRAVEEAKRAGANCIFTHHPAIFTPLRSLRAEGEGRAVLACARAGISVLSAHLNLDAAQEGIDESLMRALGGSSPAAVMEELSCGGYGRVYDVEPLSLEAFAARAERALSTERITAYGDAPVKRVASFCGAGLSEKALAFALEHGADTVVSSDGKHHLLAEAVERGMNVLLLTHYAAEVCGFKRFFETMRERTGLPCFFLADDRLL